MFINTNVADTGTGKKKKDNQRNGFENPKIGNDYKLTDAELKAAQEVSYKRYMQDQQKYDLMARQTGTLGRSIYDRLGKKGFMTGDELDAIYNDIETYQSNLRQLKSVGFDDGGALDQINSMFSVTSGMKNLYSQFGNAEEYNGAILSGNFQFDDDAEGRSERSRIYGENQSRIAELEKRIAEKEKNGEDTSADEELLELLEAQNRQYERGNKISDDFYAKYFGTDDYQKYSGKRGFSNPSGTDMQKDEMRNDSSLWKYDAEGNCYNVYGELVHDKRGNAGPGYVIENGTIRTSGAQNINDPLGLFLAAQKNGDLDNATGTPVDMEDSYIKFLKDANDAAWQELSKDEVGIYYTILNSQGVEAATQYLSDMRNTLTARYVAKEQERIIKSLDEGGFLLNAAYSLASVPMNMIGGAAAAVEGAANALGYGEYNPNSPANRPQIYAETGRATIANNIDALTGNAKLLGISLGDIYQFGMSSIDSFVGKVAGRGYTIIMGMGATSSKARELYDKGASPDQIISNAIITGALEILTEYVSIDKLLTAKSAKTFTQYLKNILKQAGVEASEEIASEIGNIIADEAIMGSQGEVEQGVSELMEEGLSEIEAYKKYIVDRVYKAGVGGFLSGGLSAGVYSGVNYVGNDISLKQEGRRILDTDNGVEDLRSLANEMAGVKEGETQSREQRRLSRYSDRAGKKQSAKNVGLLSDQVDTVRMEQNANDIAAELVKGGYKEKYARKIADAIVQVNEGAADTETEQRYNKYMSDSAIASVNDRFYGNEDSSVQTRNAEYQMRRNGTAVRNAVNEFVRGMTEADIDEKIENVKQNYSSTDNSGSDVIADTGEAIRSMRVLSVKDGKMTVEVTLEDGKTKTVDASKIDYASQDKATIYGYLAENNMVAGAVQTLVDNYTGKTDSDLKTYLLGVEEAYQYGYYGRAMQNLQFAQDLAPNQRTAAFRAGQIAAQMDLGEENARVKRAQAQAAIRQKGHRTDGRVSFEGDQKSFENLSQRQQATVDLAQQMAKVFGNHYHFFVSQTVDGKHMLDGKEVENGWYDTRSGDIWADLNAGAKGEGLALFTLTHELTHFIRQWAPSQFRALSSALVTAYEGKNVPISQLVMSQQELARKHGRTLSYDEAWEEVVANSMEGITQDGRLYEVAMQLKQENRTLWQKVKDWFADILARLKKAYAGLTPDSREANLMLQMTDQVEAMQKAWAEGLNTASQNFQSADGTMHSEKNTAKEGGVKYSVKNTRKMTWDEQMNALFSTKSLKSSDSLYLGKSEQFLEEAGIPQSTEYIPLGVVTKAMRKQSGSRSAHAMTDGQIRDLKKEINNAPAVIVNPSRNAVVYITNQPNSGGYTVVSFDINNDLFGENAHKSTSIHPQISVRNLVNSLGEDATIFVRNENRFNEIAGLLSDNPPTLLATIKSVEAMVTHDNIKSQAEISDKKLSIRQDTEYLSVAEKYRDGTATEAEIEQLRKMVDEAAKKAGYTSDTDWRMDHKAPNAKYDVPIYQVDTLYGGDGSIYSNRAAYYYGDGRSYDQKAIRVLQKVRNNPNADITVYRAVPTNRVESHVRNGDWVTTVEEYAKEHGDRVLDGEYRIIKNTVPAKYVYANGDSIHEYGYDDGKDYGYRNTENNRKLLDLVTYDDNGNIIPLSERFNPEKTDIRFSARQEESYSTKAILTQLDAETVSQLDSDGKKLLQSYQRMAKRADYYRNQIDQLRAEKNAWKGKSIHAGSVLNSALASKNAEINKLQRKLENTEKIMAGQVRNPQIARLVNTARDQAVKQLRAEKNAKIAQIRQEMNAQIDEVRNTYQQRIEASREGRKKTAVKADIRKAIKELNSLYEHGTKQKNVKNEMRGLAASVLNSFDILFTDVNQISNEGLARGGIGLPMSESQKTAMNKYLDLIYRRDRIVSEQLAMFQTDPSGDAARIFELSDELEKVKKKIKDVEYSLKDVFNAERTRISSAGVTAVIDEISRMYKSLKDSDKKYIRDAYSDVIATRLDVLSTALGGTLIKDMKLWQLTELRDDIVAVVTTIKNANKLFRKGKAEDIKNYANKVIGEIRNAVPKTKSIRAVNSDKAQSFVWNNMKPVYAMRRIGSKAFENLFWDAVNAEATYAKDMVEAGAFLEKLREKYNYAKWKRSKITKFDMGDGTTFDLDVNQMMSIYAYSFREQALDHMRVGGFKYAKDQVFKKKGVKYEHTEENTYRINDTLLAQIIGALTDEQRAYVQEMQKYLSQMGEKGNEVSRVLYGIDLFKEKFYFPLQSSSDYIGSSQQTLQQANTVSSLKNIGMAKETVPNARNPIVLRGFDAVWLEHVNKMSTYHSFVLPIDNFSKVFNYSEVDPKKAENVSFRATLRSAFGNGAVEYIEKYIQDLNGGVSSKYNSSAMRYFSKFKGNAVSASLSTAIQQPTAIIRAMAYINPDYFFPFLRASKVKTVNITKLYDELKKYAPIAIIKEMGGFDIGSNRQAVDYIGMTKGADGYKRNKMESIFSYLAEKGDVLGWTAIWSAVKKEVASKSGLTVGSEEYFKRCGDRFTEIIVLTQVYDSVNSRSGFMRSNNDLNKFATSFIAEPTTTINMLQDALMQVKRGGSKEIKQAARVFAAVITSTVAASALASIIYAMRKDPEEDQSFVVVWAEQFGMKLIGELNPLNMLPYARDIMSALSASFGNAVDRPDMTLFSDLASAIRKLASDKTGAYRKIEDFAGAIAAFFGIPVKNIMRDCRAIYNAVIYATDSVKAGNFFEGFKSGIADEVNGGPVGLAKKALGLDDKKPEREKNDLYAAIVNGDKEKVEELKSAYDSDRTYHEAIRKQLRDNDGRITDAAIQLMSGNIKGYEDYVKEIVSEGKFSQDDVVSAIRSQKTATENMIQDIYEMFFGSEEETASEGKLYTLDDYMAAVAGGQAASANNAKEYIIQDYLDSGYTHEESENKFLSNVMKKITAKYKSDANPSDSKYVRLYVQYAGMEQEDAEDKVYELRFNKNYPDYDWTTAQIKDYSEFAKPAQIPMNVYDDYIIKTYGLGNKDEILPIIDSLPISSEQKDALYYANGWSAKNIRKTPWH